MGEILDIEQQITEAECRWPTLRFKRKTHNEAASSCPFCRLGQDRFVIFSDGGYWCRQCTARGWIDEDNPKPFTETERLAHRVAALERQQEEQAQRLTALEQMAQCTDHLRYHKSLATAGRDYWYEEGIYDEMIDRYLLGFCNHCPTDCSGSPSHTIPVINSGTLENIRHRLIIPNGGKYRPHVAGLGLQLFNADSLDGTRQIIIVEGEKKAIVLQQSGFPAVGILGKRSFKKEWLDRFARIQKVVVALDPDATESAHRLAAIFGGRGRVAQIPCKIDDFIVKFGGGNDSLQRFLELARPV